MLSKENIISKLDEIRRCSNKKGFTFYISTIDLNDEKTRSTFHSDDIDEVAWHLSGQSLTCGVMTIQQIEDGQIGIMLCVDDKLRDTSIDCDVIDYILGFKK